MDDALRSLYGALDAVVLEHRSDDRFAVLTEPPAWFTQLVESPEAGGGLPLRDAWPYLDHFLQDSSGAWGDGDGAPMRSGVWAEQDLGGRLVHLEATALRHAGRPLLYVRAMGANFQTYSKALQAAREHLLKEESLEAEVRHQTHHIRRREEEISLRLVEAVNIRDDESGGHIRRIGRYAACVAKGLGWSASDIDDIGVAASMHDIGKVGVPDKILLKPGPLTPEEQSIMEGHAEIGAAMLEGAQYPLLKMASDIAAAHHENWDGSGYPHGLVGEDISVPARITAIVDVYDAMIHERAYKPALPEAEVLAHMRLLAGTKFDPEILEVFLDLLPEIRRIRTEIPDEAAATSTA